MSNPTLVRRVTAALTTLEEARTVETRPAVIAALTDSIDALNGFLLDLQDAAPDEESGDAAVTHTVVENQGSRSLSPRTIRPMTLADELWEFGCALQYAHMAVWE